MPETIYAIDIIFAVFVLLITFNGMRRGFSGELANVLTLGLLVGGIYFYYGDLLELASHHYPELNSLALQAIVYGALIAATVLVYTVLSFVLGKVMAQVVGPVIDKLLGCCFGFVSGVVMGMLILAGITLIPNQPINDYIYENSYSGRWVSDQFIPWIEPHLQELPVFEPKEEPINEADPERDY